MTDDLDELHRTIEPLPGGVLALRRRLRESPPRRRIAWVAAAAAAVAVTTLVWQLRRPGPGDRAAVAHMLGTNPHPDALALGLVVRPPARDLSDPRVSDDKVVFRWVAPVAASIDNSIDPRDPAHQLDPP